MNPVAPVRKVRYMALAGTVVTVASALINIHGLPHWVTAAATTIVSVGMAYGVSPEGSEVTP